MRSDPGGAGLPAGQAGTQAGPTRHLVAALGLSLLLGGCHFYSTVSEAGDLGVGDVRDTAILAPAPSTPASKSVPVVVLVHGFTATNYETGPAADYLAQRGFIVSRPLLGAHGTTVEELGASKWRDWGEPVAAEYRRLREDGYQNVSFLTISTGGTVVMELYSRGRLTPAPTRISMVAPILDFSDKLSGLAGLLKFFGASNSPSKQKGSSKGHWYSDRPVDAVIQLIDLTEVMKGRLRGTLRIPDDTRIQIFQSMRDGSTDPLSAQLWANGIKGGLVAVHLVDSPYHVPISPDFVNDAGQNEWTDADRSLRERIFEQIAPLHCPGTYAGNKCL